MTPESMDLVFHALASRARRAILDIVRDRPGCCVQEVCVHFDVSRIMILKHLRILEEAQLLVLKKAGRKVELYFNAVPIQMIYDRWTSEYSSYWASKIVDFKMLLESEPKKPPPSPSSHPRKSKQHEPK
ncbi:MAG: helix-turn-helix transcriptional regulator [Planctomycetaceae bacterium]|nr:helix-turn-helix transcriptional regulator [Planctomycetaceae bacterium]